MKITAFIILCLITIGGLIEAMCILEEDQNER